MYTNPNILAKGKGAAESKSFEIVLFDLNDILSSPGRDANGVKNVGDYVFKPSKYATKMQVTASKTSLPVTSEGEEDNISISSLPEFYVPGSSLEIEEFIQNWTNRSVGVGVRVGACGGGEQFYRIFGSKCAPISIIIEGQNNNDGTGYLFKFQQFAKTDLMPARYYGNFTFATATVVDVGDTVVDVTNGNGEYQLQDNTVATVITNLTNAQAAGVYTLLGSGGVNPATIEASNANFLLAGAVDWQGLSGTRLTVEAFEVAGGAFIFVEKSRS